jgi:pyruvate dehydrogenase E2 component (dihydrolipoamide acetyltransferase)
MATPVIMPRQGQSVETCIITSWLKKKGDVVKEGDILFSYETDKAAFDMEAPVDGMLLDIYFNEGDEVPVLTNVAVIGSEGEKTDSFFPAAGEKTGKSDTLSVQSDEEEVRNVVMPAPQPGSDSKVKISPRARLLAGQKGVDISKITGTGPGGRIIVRDIENTLSDHEGLLLFPETGAESLNASAESTEIRVESPGTGYNDQPLSNMRKMIATAMHSSLQNSAQVTHHMSADVRRLLEARRKIKENISKGATEGDYTLNDMICWCVIKALKKHPVINSHFLDDKIRTFTNIHLGVAVDTPRGLMVPVVRNADDKDLAGLSGELKSLTGACRKGSIDPELLQSSAASFTVSNLGNYGVEMFTPVINLPQTGILGVCSIIHRPADLGDGVLGFIPVIGLSLTYDHRAVDGGPATLFLREVKSLIENVQF